VVQAAIQLEHHPGGVGALGQQGVHPFDQVAEVETAAQGLQGFVRAGVGAGEHQGVPGVARHLGGGQAVLGLD
jgi:hypothetical protein